MQSVEPHFLTKLKWSLPWLSRYPFWRAEQALRSLSESSGENGVMQHLIVTVANHFEPSWKDDGSFWDLDTQARRVESWVKQARATGGLLRDHDGTPFRHTYFYPGEQYHRRLIEMLAGLEADGLGEVEIHLHHGVERPDTTDQVRSALAEFRDLLAEEHKCLSREDGDHRPRYAFVHGNLALANSMGGRCCGVDDEMEILAETGCYVDMTLPSAPLESQVAMINAIYQCGRPLNERAPHRTGHSLRVGAQLKLPVILTGPLVFDWSRRARSLPRPRLDDGALTTRYPPSAARLDRWRNARITVSGRPDWVFIKLYCHGFFTGDQEATIGQPMLRFWSEAIESADRDSRFKIHFATAREAFNIAMAAVDGRDGDPRLYRDYRLRPIRKSLPEKQRHKTAAFPPGY
ncbi:MAG: hypothetical protein AB7U82_24125 [Blastocatellales bacterium]